MVKQEYNWKYVVLGDGSVGKTSLVTWYTNRTFDNFYQPTLGAQFSVKEIEPAENVYIKLYLWDIAGQVKFSGIRKMFYERAHAAIFVFDVTNRNSFNAIKGWRADLIESLGTAFPSAIVANKIDLNADRQVTTEEGFELATEMEIPYYETSAKTGSGVDDAFLNITLHLLDRMSA
ncbi:MAG: Rab family GTPase [Promethearchaeota archaeon]